MGSPVSGRALGECNAITKPYTGDDQHIIEAAVEQGIGILSTVELHKIVVAVIEGALTKVAARALIKKPGRIELLPNDLPHKTQ